MLCQKTRFAETRLRCQIAEGFKGQRMRYPRVAPVHVVFHQQNRSAWFQERTDMAYCFLLIPVKMQGIGHQDTVEQGQIDCTCEIAVNEMQMLSASKLGSMRLLQGIQPVLIPVHGVDICTGAKQFPQRQGKRTGSSSQVRECGARSQVRGAEKFDMVMMIHRGIIVDDVVLGLRSADCRLD